MRHHLIIRVACDRSPHAQHDLPHDHEGLACVLRGRPSSLGPPSRRSDRSPAEQSTGKGLRTDNLGLRGERSGRAEGGLAGPVVVSTTR